MKRFILLILSFTLCLGFFSSCGRRESVITVAETHPGCLAVEDDCFYGTDENGNYWRINRNDTSDIVEGGVYAVKLKSRKILFYPGGYTNGRTPRYEATATEVREY